MSTGQMMAKNLDGSLRMFDFKWMWIGLLTGSIISLNFMIAHTDNRVDELQQQLQEYTNADGN